MPLTEGSRERLPAAAFDGNGSGPPLVVMEKVNKHFGELHVLPDVDLSVGRGPEPRPGMSCVGTTTLP